MPKATQSVAARTLAFAATCAALMAGLPATAVAAPPDPADNISMGELPESCGEATSLSCENALIYYLDKGREQMGLPPYALPANFPSQSPDRQIFILSNLDRVSYGLAPVTGLSPGLSADALQGVAEARDPFPSMGNGPYSWGPLLASNWAGSDLNVLAAYYLWYYADGYGSANIDCVSPSDAGCWGHRHGILAEASPSLELVMGAAAGTDQASNRPGYAMLILGNEPEHPPVYYYTWAQALAEGAASNAYDPGTPDLTHTSKPQGASSPGDRVRRPHLGLVVHHSAARITASPVLDGQPVEVTLKRTWKPCFARSGRSDCRWRARGRPLRLSKELPLVSAIDFRPPASWERVSIRIRTKPFSLDGNAYAGLRAAAQVSGPTPH